MNRVLIILSELKKQKISTQTVEKDLKLSNGLLGKAAKEKCKLSEEKLLKLEDYFKSKTSQNGNSTTNVHPSDQGKPITGSTVNEDKSVPSTLTKNEVNKWDKEMQDKIDFYDQCEGVCKERGITISKLIAFIQVCDFNPPKNIPSQLTENKKVLVNEIKPTGGKPPYNPFDNPLFTTKNK